MKKVTGYISTKPLGCFDFEFYVEDDTTDEEIRRQIDDMLDLYQHYDVEEGYIEKQITTYCKKN